ncbi:hypothetical protein OY671_012488, partial [Metschnikowia pulcherrima]
AADTDQARSEDSLTDRYVMIGAALSGFNDTVSSPVHDVIPGVFMHAMASDNSSTYRDHYKRASEWEIWPPNISWSSGIPIVMAAHFSHWSAQWSVVQSREINGWTRRWSVPPKSWRSTAATPPAEGTEMSPQRPARWIASGAARGPSTRS